MNKAGWWLSISWFTFLIFLFPFFAHADATFEIPYLLDADGRVHCDWDLNSYNGSNNFYSYGISKDGALISSGRTSGKTLCQDTFIASTKSGGDLFFESGRGEYTLTLYAESGLRDPYGYMVFDCPEYDVCSITKLTNAKTWHSHLIEDTTWTLSESPYLVDQLTIDNGVTLRIEAGVSVLFRNKTSFLYVAEGGTLDIKGTVDAPVTLSTINDDGDIYLPSRGDWDNVINYGTLKAMHVQLSYATHGFINHAPGVLSIDQSSVSEIRNYAILQQSGQTSITNSTIENSGSGVGQVKGEMHIFNSVLSNIEVLAAYNKQGSYNAINNYWGDASGPHALYSNEPSGTGEDIGSDISYLPYLTTVPTEPRYMDCVTDCFSNVLFLPGLEGSRLYVKEGTGSVDCGVVATGGEDCFYDEELWLSRDDAKQEKLSLDPFGKSIHDVYTHFDIQKTIDNEKEYGVLDSAYGVNIYGSFLEQLSVWKNAGLYADYAFIPYDWRLSLDDVVNNARITQIPNGRLSFAERQSFEDSVILDQLEKLQANSRTGKVIIIAHSNGGLVAKALVERLRQNNHPMYSKIEQVILVASPQAGTPEATMLLTHGVKLFKGILMSSERARGIAENMPSAYHLLPSLRYFEMVDTNQNPVITFEDHPLLAPQVAKYGTKITDHSNMNDYLLGGDGRTKPEFDDTKKANIANPYLMSYTDETHTLLDNWQPYTDTKVLEIAGWGEETLVGLDYVVRKKFLKGDEVTYKPRWVIDGDGVVVVPSAFSMLNNTNVEEWYVDLYKYNSTEDKLLSTDHKNILEVPNLVSLIYQKIQRKDFDDIDSIVLKNNLDLSLDEPRLHFTLHSPLTLGVKDTEGRYTGLDSVTLEIKQEIPGVRYERIGEVQFISAPKGLVLTLVLDGLSEGSFALDIDEQVGDQITGSMVFEGVPSTGETIATVEIGESFDVGEATLLVDTDGDGGIDITLRKKDSARVLYEEPKQAEPAPAYAPPPAVVPVWLLDTVAFVLPAFEVPTPSALVEEIPREETPIEKPVIFETLNEAITSPEVVVPITEIPQKEELLSEVQPEVWPVENDLEQVDLAATAVQTEVSNTVLWYVFAGLVLVLVGLKFIRG